VLRGRAFSDIGWRVAAVVALFGHLVAALGVPIPTEAPVASSVPFPCQGHPCGCFSAEECWDGDCCCYTLEQKLAWAKEQGIEPPPHVRPLVEARKARAAEKKSCCCDQADGHAECPSCAEKATSPAPTSGVELKKKCRGQAPSGAIELPPSTAPDRRPSGCSICNLQSAICNHLMSPSAVTHVPPTPPPR
jgi:hypothetical protein